MATKRWWESKTIWANIVSITVVVLKAADEAFGTKLMSTPVVVFLLALANAFSIYGRVSAEKIIK